MGIKKEKFYEIYHRNILPKLKSLEPKRKSMLSAFVIQELLIFFSMLFCAFISCKMIMVNFDILLSAITPIKGTVYILLCILLPFITLVLLFMFYYIFKKKLKNYKNFVKQNIMSDFTKNFNLSWYSKIPMKSIPLRKSDIFSTYLYEEYDDTFQGKYNETMFQIQELKLIKEEIKVTNSGESIAKPLNFRGVVICLQSNKVIRAKTIITSVGDTFIRNNYKRTIVNYILLLQAIFFTLLFITEIKDMFPFVIIMWIIAIFGFFIPASSQRDKQNILQEVKLEDLSFGKRFKVSSENQIEARYLVTTAFMERLLNIQTAFGTKDIKCSFFDDKVMFAISTKKDLFELGNLFVPLTDKRQIETFYKELSSIYNMIDYFKLTEKTGL